MSAFFASSSLSWLCAIWRACRTSPISFLASCSRDWAVASSSCSVNTVGRGMGFKLPPCLVLIMRGMRTHTLRGFTFCATDCVRSASLCLLSLLQLLVQSPHTPKTHTHTLTSMSTEIHPTCVGVSLSMFVLPVELSVLALQWCLVCFRSSKLYQCQGHGLLQLTDQPLSYTSYTHTHTKQTLYHRIEEAGHWWTSTQERGIKTLWFVIFMV